MKTATQRTRRLNLLLIMSFIFVENTHSMQRMFSSLGKKKIKKVKTAELRDGTFVDAQYIQIIDDIFTEKNDGYAALFNQIRKKCINRSYHMDPEAEIVSREFALHPLEDEDACIIIKNLFIHIKINEEKIAIISYPFKKIEITNNKKG